MWLWLVQQLETQGGAEAAAQGQRWCTAGLLLPGDLRLFLREKSLPLFG